MNASPHAELDAEHLAELHEDVGEDYVLVLNAYADDADELGLQLQGALAEGRWDDVAEIAHAVKGSFSNVGASRLSEESENLELAARDGRQDRARDLAMSAIARLARVRVALIGLAEKQS